MTAQNLSGQTVRGYRVGEALGRGSYGVVYRATQAAIGREVAIKVILPEHAASPDFAQRFELEARTVAGLEHPHIIPLYDFWQDESGLFLVMRLLSGGSLRQRLAAAGPLETASVLQVMEQVCSGLAAAHAAGVVHRDVKPGNILFDAHGNAYLSDFGIAKNLQADANLTDSHAVVGSPAYFSPEQIMAQPVGPESDIYSFGIVLYEMLAGEHPFAGTPVLFMINKHLDNALPAIDQKVPGLPADLNEVIQRATAKDRAARYHDVMEMLADVRVALQSRGQSPTRILTQKAAPVWGTITSSPPIEPSERNRASMLENVHHFWIEGVLQNSLHGALLLELGMKQETEQVAHPWRTLLLRPDEKEEELPPGTRITDVYDRLNGKLLILGEPGSGKTTTLLELARALLERARQDAGQPIPVVFNLSSWSAADTGLAAWLVDELRTKYQVPRPVAEGWVSEDRLLLLLDGLDEVMAERREECVRAINEYRAAHGFVDMAVCSRLADYRALRQRLNLNGAVVIQPLQMKQIRAYLAALGPAMQPVLAVLEADEALAELARSPLMLSVMALAYRDLPPEEVSGPDSPTARRDHLFKVYVKRMLVRRMGEKPYPAGQTRHYLAYLGERLTAFGQSVFQIENIQPAWLDEGQRARYHRNYQAVILLYGALAFALPWLLFALWQGPELLFGAAIFALAGMVRVWVHYLGPPRTLNLRDYTLTGVSSGLAAAVSFAWTGSPLVILVSFAVVTFSIGIYSSAFGQKDNRDEIAIVENVHFSRQRANLRGAIPSVVIGMVLVLWLGLLFGREGLAWWHWAVGLLGGGAILGAFSFYSSGLAGDRVAVRSRPNQGIRSTFYHANRFEAALVLTYLLLGLVAVAPVTSFQMGLTAAFAAWIITSSWLFNGCEVIKHVVLRRVLQQDGCLPANLARFLNFAVDEILMRRVGGSYIFIHRSLQEYFASQWPPRRAREESAD